MRGVRELSKRFAGGLQRCAYSSKSGGSDFQIAAGVPPVGDRTVYIFPPARTAGQQGIAQTVEGKEPSISNQHLFYKQLSSNQQSSPLNYYRQSSMENSIQSRRQMD